MNASTQTAQVLLFGPEFGPLSGFVALDFPLSPQTSRPRSLPVASADGATDRRRSSRVGDHQVAVTPRERPTAGCGPLSPDATYPALSSG